jgi:GT2 family glycosyltransferase
MSRVGAVVIGRNEAHNLRRCLASVVEHVSAVVFVDSGSTDGSVELVRGLGVDVVELDPSASFTVARARNAGAEYLIRRDPSIELVQFVDGDSEMVSTWFERGRAALTADPGAAVAFGCWRERNPATSMYARVYQMDSDPRLGGTADVPGMCMVRAAAFRDAGGFNADLRGLEDRELSLRLRRRGWRLAFVDAEMAVHETGICDWKSWGRRRMRGGHALAHAVALHGPWERKAVRRTLSAAFWGAALPATVVIAVMLFGARGLLLLAAYPIFAGIIYRRVRRLGFARRDAAAYAWLVSLAKFPQMAGQVQFLVDRLRRRSRAGG